MTNFTNYPTLMGHRTLYDFIVANRKKQDSGFPLSDMYVDDEGNSDTKKRTSKSKPRTTTSSLSLRVLRRKPEAFLRDENLKKYL